MTGYYGFTLDVRLSVRPSVIFTELGMYIDIVEILFGIANRKISSLFDRVICPPYDNGWKCFNSFNMKIFTCMYAERNSSSPNLHAGLQCLYIFMLASVAQLDAHPTGDQEVTGSTPAEVGNILLWRLIMKYFLRLFSPFR